MNKAKYLLLGLLLFSLVFAPAQEDSLLGGDGGDDAGLFGGGGDDDGGLFGGGDSGGDDGGDGGLFEGGDDSAGDDSALDGDDALDGDAELDAAGDDAGDDAVDATSTEAEDFEEMTFTYRDVPVTPERRIIDFFTPATVASFEVNILPGIEIEENNEEEFDLVEYHVQFGHMIEMSPNLYVSVGVKSSIYDFTLDNFNNIVGNDENEVFYAFDLPLALHFVASDQLMISLEVTPGLHSDLQGAFDVRDLQIRGGLNVSYAVSNTLALILGVHVMPDQTSYRVIPVGGVVWRPDPQLEVRVLAPYEAKAIFNLNKFNLSFIAFYESIFFEHFRIDDDNQFAGGQDDDVNFYSMRAGLGVRYEFTKGFFLELLGGGTWDGELDFNKNDAADRSLEGGRFFAKVGFTVNASIFED
ncbi:hypothetical protein [Candidatus Uabimicrobium amorphum]|uniref:Outer membrane protein beta-barrel domain-containing protein n=1 Tax=Uabimicrobium amorphum TaxID=2596890 RepID=A0A5S9F1J7_UABAM|nr:hypothetical protein [Candidatus Uabimicrobium amorphum]BBM82261.1 hypothetical protein UABAM_00604 [Candidatus Uabimicrobium amorphum]